MSVAQKIQRQVSKFPEGTIFKYQQLALEPKEYYAAAKSIERLIEKGKIERASTGVFYKPKNTVFGKLKPNEDELLRAYLFENGKRIAYITGISLYNKLGLTTQIPKNIKIASRKKKIAISINNIKATPVKSYVDVTDDNFYLLQLLDVVKDFKQIPDIDKDSAIKILTNKLENLSSKDARLIIEYGLAYPPRARSFLGALMQQINVNVNLKKLKDSLNPFSEYDLGIDKNTLPTIKDWRIK